MKFLCNSCGAPFDEPRYTTYRDTDTGSHVECSCPLCGSDNIESGVRPCVCGKPMAEAVVRANYVACAIKLTTMMALERMVAV